MMEYQPVSPTQPAPAPDETGYYMPSDSWVYGDPGQNGIIAPMAAPQTQQTQPAMQQTQRPQQAQYTNQTLPARQEEVSQIPIPGMNGGETPSELSSAAAQSQRMKNPVDMANTHKPGSQEDAYQASLRSLLNRNLGYFVEATFLIGPDRPITWKGILHTVGSDYVVLYQPDYERYVSGDLYSLKFVQFHNVKGIPYCSAAQSWQGHPNL